MALSKMLKRPAAVLPKAKSTSKSKAGNGSEEDPSSKKGSMNDSIKRMKSSACLAIKDGEEEAGDEGMEVDDEEGDDAFVARDKGFALKFQRMKKDLPGYVVDLIENQSSKAAHPRDFKSRMINKLFKRDSSGKIHLNLNEACFKEHKKLFNENFSKSSEIAYPESIFKGMFYAGNDDKFEAALAKGEICEAKSTIPGVRFFSFKTFKAVQKTGSREEEELTSSGKVTKEQAQLMSECFAKMGWKIKHTADDTRKFAKGGTVPTNIETVLGTAMEAQQKLAKDAMTLLRKWGREDSTAKNLKSKHKQSQEFMVKLEHIKQFRELPDDEEMNKANFDKFLMQVAEHTEEFNVLVESSKGAMRAKSN